MPGGELHGLQGNVELVVFCVQALQKKAQPQRVLAGYAELPGAECV